MRTCALCNEPIEPFQFELGEIKLVAGEFWHLECFAEYFEVALEEV